MRLRNFIHFFLFFFLNFLFFNSLSQDKNVEEIENFKKIIYTLSDDSLFGRAAGSEGEEKAKRYLLNYYKEVGLSPIKSSFIQEFTFQKDSFHADTAYNLIGYIDNKSDSAIIIGAHYDHIGSGGTKSKSLTSSKIHNGADDNASGVAIMLSLAEYLKKSENKKFNYLFIAFSAHEDGLYGSEAFVAEKKYDLDKVKLMLNFDMVGHLDAANPILKIIRSENEIYLDTLLNNTGHTGFQLKFDANPMLKTDASAFHKKNIPAITFTTGIHDDYHKISDDASKINYEGMSEIVLFLKDFLKDFSYTLN